MYETEIDNAIRQLQAGSARAAADLTLIALAPARDDEQYHKIGSAIYAVLDDAHLQSSRRGKNGPPLQAALCFASLATILTRCPVCPSVQGSLQNLALHWVQLHQWILYLKSDFVDNERVDLSFRLLVKRCLVDFLGILHEPFLRQMFGPIVGSPGIIATLFSLWRMETQDHRFSLPANPSSLPMRHSQATLDSWMSSISKREKWDWSEILRPFGGEADVLAATTLDRLRQDVARVPAYFDLVIWDIHLLMNLSTNKIIRIPLLKQHSMTILTDVIQSMVVQYSTTNQHLLVAKCISFGYRYIRAYVESTEGLPWIIEVIEAGLLSTILSTEPWIKHFDNSNGEGCEAMFLLLKQIIPEYSIYTSVLKSIVKQLGVIGTAGLLRKLDKSGSLFQSWSVFLKFVRNRAEVYNLTIANERHTESCRNAKCNRTGPSSSFKSCAGCLHVYYCSRECQLYDWKNGGHQKYCHDFQAYRAGGLILHLPKHEIHFIDRIVAQDLISFRDRIQGTAVILDLNPVVVELDYTEVPVQVNICSIQELAQKSEPTRTNKSEKTNPPAIRTCQRDLPLTQKWNHMIQLAQKSASNKVLVRALLPGGTSQKVKLQYLPLGRTFGHTPMMAGEPTSELDGTFNLLYSRVGQSHHGDVDAAFPSEALRAKEKSGIELCRPP